MISRKKASAAWDDPVNRVNANVMSIGKTTNFLLAVLIFSIPWVKLELRPSIDIAEVLFILLSSAIIFQSLIKQLKFPSHILREDFGLVIAGWLIAVLCSGFNVPHPRSYIFEAGGMAYLGALSIVFAIIGAWGTRMFQRVIHCLTYSVVIVAIASLVGIGEVVITGHYDLFFYSNAAKLIATFKYPNQLAGFLVLFLPLAWELLLENRGSRRVAYGLLLLAMLGGVAASGSRAGLATTGLVMGIYFAWYLLRRKVKMVLGLAIAGGVTIALIYSLKSYIGVIARGLTVLNTVLVQGHVTDSFRLKNWSNALLIFQVHPVTGYGLGNIWRDFGYEVHNTYLSVLAEMGLIGAVALILLFGYILYISYCNVRLTQIIPRWRPYARGLFMGLLAEYIYASQHLMIRSRHLWLVFGLVIAMNTLLRRAKSREGANSVRNLWSAKS